MHYAQHCLQASLWMHDPYRNEKFGSPVAVTQSLWAGVMTWHLVEKIRGASQWHRSPKQLYN